MLDLVVERNTSTDVIFRSTLDTIHYTLPDLPPRGFETPTGSPAVVTRQGCFPIIEKASTMCFYSSSPASFSASTNARAKPALVKR